jgi:DNA-binding response OmpR family regulator
MMSKDSDRLILRAEVRSADETVVSSAMELTADSVFVATDWHAAIDTRVAVQLSFPNLLEPIELPARVGELRASDAPGDPRGIRLVFEPDASADARGTLTALLDRLNRTVPPMQASPYRVLLVEDNWLIRDVFEFGAARFFEHTRAVAVDHADSAERAWDKLASADYDLVIVDYYLPSGDGASLIAKLRSDPRLAPTPVVAISVGGRDAREASIAAGADVFLDKPVVFRDLFNTLRAVFQHDAARRANRKTILVLDDSPLVLAITRAALETAGFDVVIAEDLSAFERNRAAIDPDLILVDVQMPEAFGDDVASTLVGWHGVRAPVLLVSSLDEAELAARARQARVAGYICKGAGMTELVRRCKEFLE